MKIDISKIIKIDGAFLNIGFNEPMEDLNSIVSDFIFNNPVKFEGRLVNISGVLKLEGRLSAEYTTKCYRCLKDIGRKMDINIREDLVKSDKSTDSEVYTYEGNYIEIDKILKDNIILNLPIRQACTENCKGLCPKCGIDLNVKECECMEDSINPKMEVLKNFFSD